MKNFSGAQAKKPQITTRRRLGVASDFPISNTRRPRRNALSTRRKRKRGRSLKAADGTSDVGAWLENTIRQEKAEKWDWFKLGNPDKKSLWWAVHPFTLRAEWGAWNPQQDENSVKGQRSGCERGKDRMQGTGMLSAAKWLDAWMPSPTRWTCIWASSRSWRWTGRPGVLQSLGPQRSDTTELLLNWLTDSNESLTQKDQQLQPFEMAAKIIYFLVYRGIL